MAQKHMRYNQIIKNSIQEILTVFHITIEFPDLKCNNKLPGIILRQVNYLIK